jgi:hypothetical protein
MFGSAGIVNVFAAGDDAVGVALSAASVADGDGIEDGAGAPTGAHAAVRQIAMSTVQLRMWR